MQILSKYAYLLLALLLCVPVWAQVAPSVTGGLGVTNDETRMLIPPPVSVLGYAVLAPSEERTNYLSAGVIVSGAYDDNVLVGSTPRPVSDSSYSFWPTIRFDRSTSRLSSILAYNSGYTFYHHTSALNETDQNASGVVSYRVSPNVTATALDFFQKSSNVFGQPFSYSVSVVPGMPQSGFEAIIAPFVKRTTNTANVEVTYQYRMNDMVGVAGDSQVLNYPDPSQAPGLYNSNSYGGSGFYSHRFSRGQYAGALYQYERTDMSPLNLQNVTQASTLFGFYTFYLKPNLSLSFAGGPQYFDTALTSLDAHSWRPAGAASLEWQQAHTTVVATYSRTVTAGGGLLGVFDSDSANLSVRWQLTRDVRVGVTGTYAQNRNAAPSIMIFNPGGHGISGSPSIAYRISNQLEVEGGYDRLHQSYNGISILANNPDSNREYISLSYQFKRPLGR